MRGNDKIIQSRLAGVAPGAIYFIDHKDDAELEFGDVYVFGDHIGTLDLRFVAGMLVAITSDNQKRMEQLVAQCRKFHARQIAYGLQSKYY